MLPKIIRFAPLLWAASLLGSGFTLGQYAQGGVIFFLTPDKGHGLVAAISDQDGGSGLPWGNDSTATNATLDGIFFGPNYSVTSGSLNTGRCIALLGNNAEAAAACQNYSTTVDGTTYTGWFLPSQSELTLMLFFQDFINTTCSNNGGTALETSYYWSSLETSETTAKALFFGDPITSGIEGDKTSLYKVRAIRAF
jgi:hypothetical protein